MPDRKYIDCRDFPESRCSLRIGGEEEEVLTIAVRHAVQEHGHRDTPELQRQLRGLMKLEQPATIGQVVRSYE